MKDAVRARIKVTGVVQGVGYRYFARNIALRLGLTGYVRNLPDGSVEVVAEGKRAAINALIDDLKVGPRYASVERVDVKWEEASLEFSSFDYAF